MTLGQKVVKAVFCLGDRDKRRTLRQRIECRDKDEEKENVKKISQKHYLHFAIRLCFPKRAQSLKLGVEYIIDTGNI